MQFVSPEVKLTLTAPERFGNVAEKLTVDQQCTLASDIVSVVKIDEGSMSDFLGEANGYLKKLKSNNNAKAPSQSSEQQGSNEGPPPSTQLTLSAVIQFTARVTESLLSDPDLFKASEPGGEKLAAWLSSQIRTYDPDWIVDTDPLVMHMGVTGLAWRKRYFDDYSKQFRTRFRTVNDVILNANVKSMERCPRITDKLDFYPFEIVRAIESGLWIDYAPDFTKIDPQAPQSFYETDLWLDVDGDGYDEPWTVTLALEPLPRIIRMVPRWTKRTITDTKDTLQFRPYRRFYDYRMLPDPEGGFFPKGFGWLLDRIEGSADRLLASIDDTAKSAAENGGIASTGVGLPDKIELKNDRINTINTDGMPITEALALFPAKQVTPGMVQTFEKLVTLGDRLAGTLNMMENAPASMTATMARGVIDSGAQVQSAVHRRMIAGITVEGRAFAEMARAMDKLPDDIVPGPIAATADPNLATELQRSLLIQFLFELLKVAMESQGAVYSPQAIGQRILEVARIANPQQLAGHASPPQPSEAEKLEGMIAVHKEKTARIKATGSAILQGAQALKALAEARGLSDQLQSMQGYIAQLEQMIEQLAQQGGSNDDNATGSGMAGAPNNQGAGAGDQGAAGPGSGSIALGPTGQPDSAGAGGGAPALAGPVAA